MDMGLTAQLGVEAKALVTHARTWFEPTGADRSRNALALAARLPRGVLVANADDDSPGEPAELTRAGHLDDNR